MSRSTRYSALAIGILIALPMVALRSQTAEQAILNRGPADEAELDRLVGWLIETGDEDRARSTFVDWLSVPAESFRGCHYCIGVLEGRNSSATSAARHAALRSALDDVEALAQSRAEPELLMRLVSVLSHSAESRDLAGYYLLRARALGELSDSDELIAAVFLANSGQYEAGLNIVRRIHEDPESGYYQSRDTRQWIRYLNERQTLMDRIEQQLAADPIVTATYEYLPAYKGFPVYPQSARDTGTEGDVVVEYTITSAGRTSDATVVSSSNEVFESSALASVADYRYMPRIQNGAAVDVPGVKVKILYRLDQ